VAQLVAAFPCHCIFHQPAARRVQGMGVAVLVHKKFKQCVQQLPSPCTSMQFQAVRLRPPAVPLPLVVVNCYMPPVGSPQFLQVCMRDQYMHLTTFLQSHPHAATVLGGDLNAHLQFACDMAVTSTNESGAHLLDLIDACGMQFALKHHTSQPPTYSTYHGSRRVTSSPDHIVTSNNLPAHLRATICTDVVGSDHLPVALHICWHAFAFHAAPLPLTPHMRIRWQGRREAFSAALQDLLAQGAREQAVQLLQTNGVHAAMDALVETVLFAAIKSDHNLGAPRTHLLTAPQPTTCTSQPWFDTTCRHLREHYMYCLRQHGHGHGSTRAARGEYNATCRARQRRWSHDAVDLLVDSATRDPHSGAHCRRRQSLHHLLHVPLMWMHVCHIFPLYSTIKTCQLHAQHPVHCQTSTTMC
jgi:exonuclease III